MSIKETSVSHPVLYVINTLNLTEWLEFAKNGQK